ncbi:MAG: N-acetylmuramoyl-L-alanine amidase [Vulcanimicrobiota bacterium]
MQKKFFLIIILVILIFGSYSHVLAAPYVEKTGVPKPSKEVEIDGQPEKEASEKKSDEKSFDPFSDEESVKFEFDEKKLKKVTIYSCGQGLKIKAYEIKPGELLIPLSHPLTGEILKKYQTTARYDRENQDVVFTRSDEHELRMRIDFDEVDHSGTEKDIPIPPRIIEGMVYISPNSFSKFIWGCFQYDEKNDIYYLDPYVLDVYLETNSKGLTKVVAKGTGPLKERILKLKEPTRFVLDVMNACLDGKAREINHPVLGAIRFSQHELMGKEGNIVRIVIPESEEIEVVLTKARTEKFAEAELRPRQSLAPIQDLAIQQIEDISVTEDEHLVTMTVDCTGPVQMEWNRLLPPDNRFFVDIPGLVYPDKKKTIKLKNDFVPQINIAQFEPRPNPIIRMVLPLEDSQKVTIKTDPDSPDRFKIFIARKKVKPRETARKGFLVSYYPSTGLVICLDPGHGGSDPGAVNRSFKAYEKELALDISRRMKQLLQKNGWTVIMTRTTDRDVSYPGSPDYEELDSRTSIANDLNADIFVSVHINASVKSSVRGFATYWYKGIDKDLASLVQQSMVTGLSCKNLGIRRERFFVVTKTKMPAILLECGFISNPSDVKNLKKPEYRQKIAESVVQGIQAYAYKNKLNNKKK